LISNSNFKIQLKFEKVFHMKVVELEILKISYFGNFSSHYMILGVIWQKQSKGSCVLGGATVPDESPPGTARHGHRRAVVAFGQLPGASWPPAVASRDHRAGRLRICCLSYKAPRCRRLFLFSVFTAA
jgi:hypothetical protein